MVQLELREVSWSRKFYTFTNPEYGALASMVMGELDEGFDDLEWSMLWYGYIDKDFDSGSIKNDEVRGNFLAGYLVEEDEANMKASTCIDVFCGYIGIMAQSGSRVNNKSAERVGNFGDKLL